MKDYNIYIGRNIRTAAENIEVLNPATEEHVARFPNADKALLDEAIACSRKAQQQWGKSALKERKEVLRAIAAALLENVKPLAELETREIGKCFKESLFVDIPLAAEAFNYYASLLDTMQSAYQADKDTTDTVEYVPYGVAGIFLPYNVPLMIFGFSAAAALAAGNAVIIKPSEYGSLSLLEFAEVLQKTDVPEGLITILSGKGATLGQELARSSVDILSFTGSEQTLKHIIAASVEHPKKIVCELGGCNLAIVCKDAPMTEAVENVLGSAFIKQGQMCIKASVALIDEEIFDIFVERLKERLKKIKIGNPFDASVGIGPLPKKHFLEALEKKVESLVRDGAKVLYGGKKIASKGYFYTPTILEIDTLRYEELFMPVLLVKKFSKEEELTSLIQKNPTGLTAQVWSNDFKKARQLAGQIEAGTVWINTFAQMSPAFPFGGMKGSGWGSSLGMQGFLEYSRAKHIGMAYTKSKVSGWFGI